MRTAFMSICIGLCLACGREISLLPDGTSHLHLLNVGQGDAILFVTPSGGRIMVDGGPDLTALSAIGAHLPQLSRRIDLLVLTHSDADHITALPEILRRYDVRRLLLTGQPHASGSFESLLTAAKERGTTVLIADPDTDIVFSDGVTLDTVWPDPEELENLSRNDASVVMRILHKEHSILLTGDMEEVAEQALLASGRTLSADVLKVGHHGSRTSSSTGFLLAANPSIALISSGKDNRYGHPHTEVTERFAAMNIPIKNTANEGGIELTFR